MQILISQGNLTSETFSGQNAIVTGGGGGIGFEAARALAWLGADVIIAEINEKTGKAAAERINQELSAAGKVVFIKTDVGDERSVDNLAKQMMQIYEKVDIVLNNAAVEPVGSVENSLIEDWDFSYKVNMRGPVLMARKFLPDMLKRNSGVIVCVASVGGAYMGPYETMKAAQIELANILDAECEGTGVNVFTIGPGLVIETPGAQETIPKVAQMYGKSFEEFCEMSKTALISVEAAGTGFAAAIALAPSFRGKQITSFEALQAAGISLPENGRESTTRIHSNEDLTMAKKLSYEIHQTLEERNTEWKSLGIFQRKWMFNDFTKKVGISIDEFLDILKRVQLDPDASQALGSLKVKSSLAQLAKYYVHLQELTRGFVKDKKILEEQLLLQKHWQETAQQLIDLFR